MKHIVHRKKRVVKTGCSPQLWVQSSIMISHAELQTLHYSGRRKLALLVKQGLIQFAGNRRLKIYGRLSCSSGKRMRTINRVFFATEQEAIENGYRPCGHCLRHQYLLWKKIK